jgi:hypothetical protein
MFIYFNSQCFEQVRGLTYHLLSGGTKESYPGLGFPSTVKRYLIKTLPSYLINCIILNHPSNCLTLELSFQSCNFTRFLSVTPPNRLLLVLCPYCLDCPTNPTVLALTPTNLYHLRSPIFHCLQRSQYHVSSLTSKISTPHAFQWQVHRSFSLCLFPCYVSWSRSVQPLWRVMTSHQP